MFPCAVPVRWAGHPRVTHPSAASATEVAFARLACLRRAASVRSEPGSNSPSWTPQARGPRLSPFFPAARQTSGFCRSFRIDRGSLPLLVSLFPFAHCVKRSLFPAPSALRRFRAPRLYSALFRPPCKPLSALFFNIFSSPSHFSLHHNDLLYKIFFAVFLLHYYHHFTSF